MKNLNLPPFYVGQKVVAIRNHSQGAFKKGDEFTVTGVFKACCDYNITIGVVATDNMGTLCSACRAYMKETNGEWYFNPASFRPLQQQNFPLITLSKIREKEKEEYLVAN